MTPDESAQGDSSTRLTGDFDQGKAGQKIQFFAQRTKLRKTSVVVFRLGVTRRVCALPDRARSAK